MLLASSSFGIEKSQVMDSSPMHWQARALDVLAGLGPGGNPSIYCPHVLTL